MLTLEEGKKDAADASAAAADFSAKLSSNKCAVKTSPSLSPSQRFSLVCVYVLTICLTDARNGATFQIHDQTRYLFPINLFQKHCFSFGFKICHICWFEVLLLPGAPMRDIQSCTISTSPFISFIVMYAHA